MADDLHVRVLKFPSGELLSRAWLDAASPQVTIGPIQGQIDELKAFAATKGRVRLAQYANTGDTTLTANVVNIPFQQNGGLFKLGDEYIGYGTWTQNQTNGTITQAQRGWLNSTKEIHDQLLPTGMKVHVHFINQQHTGRPAGDVFTEVRVENRTTARDVCNKRHHVADAVAQSRQRQAAVLGVSSY